MQEMRLDFVPHMVAMGRILIGEEAVFILVGEAPYREAILLGCPHVCDRLVEQLREARAAAWPTGGPDESDEYHREQIGPDVEATYLGGNAQGNASVADVKQALAGHERAARMLRKWLDTAEREG